jgi:hypothetical protein
MTTIEKTGLETAVLDRFHQLYEAQGFPPAERIGVLRRENTGGGRYVDLECDAPLHLEDGYIDLGGSFIEMKGLPNGMMAVVLVKGGHATTLEFTVYGGDSWNGEESDWRIV